MDIVERLRTEAPSYVLIGDAAVEIERLQEEIFSLRTEAHFDDQALGSYQEVNERLEKEIKRLREVLQKIADIEHEDIPSPTTPNEANVWTVLAMTIGLAEKALKEGE